MKKQLLAADALRYHREPKPGKISIAPTKKLTNQRDLSLAYSPGVAAACEAIVEDADQVHQLTARANLVGVITNGTAVLGLGDIGPLAAKPVMEGKAVLFKVFSGIDVFDIEINEKDPQKLTDIIASLEPTFGGINLEDIKAPECFQIERALKKRLKIPVFHDDQHGTAIIVGAACLNAIEVVGKDIASIKLVVSGAGAAALACLDLLHKLGIKKENIWVSDIIGVVYHGRTELMDEEKSHYAQHTEHRTLDDIIPNADMFLGLSAGGVLTAAMVKKMAPNPIIFALANPNPEIIPSDALAVRPDAIMATGRSDYPNQVNNVLCFPFIFRGALDVGATEINEDMKIAAVKAISELAKAEQSDMVTHAYGAMELKFGKNYLIPKPFDPRLILTIAPAVAQAAMDSGVATRPIKNWTAYQTQLSQFVYHSGFIMKPIFQALKEQKNLRIAYAEGENEKVLNAVQMVIDEGFCRPILIGRPQVIRDRIEKIGLRMRENTDYEVVNPESDPRYRDYWMSYYHMMKRRGLTMEHARRALMQNNTLIGAMMVHKGDAAGMLCGTHGGYREHLGYIDRVLGFSHGDNQIACAMNALLMGEKVIFIADTYVNETPTKEQFVSIATMASEKVKSFGLTPKVAFVSHSSFGSRQHPQALAMAEAVAILQKRYPDLEVDGEMHGDAALSTEIRQAMFPESVLKTEANVLIMPTLETAHVAANLLKMAVSEGVTVGPVLMGCKAPVHILTPSATARRIYNMSAMVAIDIVSQSRQSQNK